MRIKNSVIFLHIYLQNKHPAKFEIPSLPPEDVTTDWIGPPDTDSNLRPYRMQVPIDETPMQQKLRLQRIQNQNWNQQFWAEHNNNFTKVIFKMG